MSNLLYLGLNGQGATRIINDFSPLRVAFDMADKKVMVTPIMLLYNNQVRRTATSLPECVCPSSMPACYCHPGSWLHLLHLPTHTFPAATPTCTALAGHGVHAAEHESRVTEHQPHEQRAGANKQ